jgi:hypothetical protein
MGYVYSGNTATGIIALTLISLMSGMTYAAWKTDVKPVAVLTGTISCFFYGGSIIGGYYEAQRYNRNIDENVINSIDTVMDYDTDYRLLYNKYGLGKVYE